MYRGCYLLGKIEVLLLWTTGKIKTFMHIISMRMVSGDVKGVTSINSVNVCRVFIVSRPRVQRV